MFAIWINFLADMTEKDLLYEIMYTYNFVLIIDITDEQRNFFVRKITSKANV